ncbi:MAG: hypothetical protein AABY49_02135 [Planctomycetota bacterium]
MYITVAVHLGGHFSTSNGYVEISRKLRNLKVAATSPTRPNGMAGRVLILAGKIAQFINIIEIESYR